MLGMVVVLGTLVRATRMHLLLLSCGCAGSWSWPTRCRARAMWTESRLTGHLAGERGCFVDLRWTLIGDASADHA